MLYEEISWQVAGSSPGDIYMKFGIVSPEYYDLLYTLIYNQHRLPAGHSEC